MKVFALFICLIMTIMPNKTLSAEMEMCDSSKCNEYFKKYKNYARIGYVDAMSAVGEFYYHGYGTDKNLDKALSKLKKAAKYGSYGAPVKVALIRLTDPRLKDVDEAMKYLRKAARYNHPDAVFLLGMIYYSDKIGDYDIESADKFLAKSYDSNHRLILKFIEHIDGKGDLTIKKFPILKSKIDSKLNSENMKVASFAKVSKSNSISHPQSKDIEIITIHAPNLSEIFTRQFEIFDSTSPEKNSGSSFSITRRSCEESVGCTLVDKTNFKRMLNLM
ncbi:MAG: tetratricopeptide (TPR) repeat protein [Colwellia sp.]|jgi:tetratricopeptide (TPR) repeat protein